MDVIATKQRIAVKDHKCNFCGLTIPKGEKYDWQKNVYEGALYEWKAHLSCCDIASELSMYDYADEGVTEEDFKETINDEYNRICDPNEKVLPPFETRLLTVKQKYGIV